MSDARPDDQRVWERGWEGHAEAQRRRLAKLPLAQKLAWLEQADRVIRHLTAQRRRASGEAPSAGREKT